MSCILLCDVVRFDLRVFLGFLAGFYPFALQLIHFGKIWGLERLKMRFCIFKLKILMYLLFVWFDFVLLRKVSFKQIKTIMGILSDYWEEQMEESNRKHYGEEAYLLIKKCQAEVLEWKEIAHNKDNEIKRLQSIIDSQRQSHAWEIAELEKRNVALRNIKHN